MFRVLPYMMLTLGLALAGFSGVALACDDHVGKCELDAVKASYSKSMRLLSFHGSATCDRGRVVMRVYEGDEFLGVVSDGFRGHAIRTTHVDAPADLKIADLKIKYSIDPR